jgi:uncharacterized protein (TIGR02145 family)
VTINKSGLSKSIYKESIILTSFNGPVRLTDIIIPVYLNGAMDGDGNYYKIVTIGTQTWMAENLKTTRYNNGTAIPMVTEKTEWNALNIPGYCLYNDAAKNKDIYGALYNWYAVNTGNLCPAGWHVSTSVELTTLSNYLGGAHIVIKLKETGTTHWLGPNDGTNESGFTALPGGYRNVDGYTNIGTYGAWWLSTENSTTHGNDWWFSYDNNDLIISSDIKQNGLSVRCLKN